MEYLSPRFKLTVTTQHLYVVFIFKG